MNAEQLDLGFDVEQTPWGKWVNPDRRAAQVQRFLDRVGLQRIPSEPWPEGSPEVARLDPIMAELFPDLETAMAPENADIADAFICFMGECFIRFTGARWIEGEWCGRDKSFYDDVNPAILHGDIDEDVSAVWGFMRRMIDFHPGTYEGRFSYFAAALREYQEYHDDKLREEASM